MFLEPFSVRGVQRLAISLALLTAAGVPATFALAQDDEEAGVDRVLVTGSRLRGIVGGDAWPLTVISRDALLASGELRLGDMLQQLPFTSGSPLNTSTSQRGQGGGLSRGIETVELRGLGPERTLILVNGKRFVPGGNGASGLVDLGMLPMSMVERIEVFKSGASVEYGADALAGVINIITRDRFDGVEVGVRGSSTSRGDAETFSFNALAGKQTDRGGFALGIEYSDQPSLSKGARDFSQTRLTLDGPTNERVFDGSSAPPAGQFRTSFGRFTLIDGRDGEDLDDFRPFVNSGPDTDRFNFNPFEDLLQASERLTLFGQGRWQATDKIVLFAEAFYHDRSSRQQLAPLPFFTTRLADVTVSANNVFNPFGETLTDVRRRLVEAGPRTFSQDNQAWRFVLGGEGRLADWFWDLSLTHGRNETDQTKTGDLLADRVRQALGPSFVDGSGTPVCGTPAMPQPDCVPLNLFGGPGSISDDMLGFVGTRLGDSGFNEQTVVNANLAGDVLQLPDGPLVLATGVEWREERAAERPDPQSQAGNTTGNARATTRGGFDAAELYLELGVPLLTDRPLARQLDLDLGGRIVDFDNFGTETLFEVGLGWQPTEHFSLRANWSEAFRAPNVGELFGGLAQANPIVNDPCSDFSSLTPVRIERCIAQGVPADGSFDQSGEETPELSGGNPNLEPEQGEIFTAGLSWKPLGRDGPGLRLDYYDIEVEDGIGALGAETILAQCLATGGAGFCSAIDRAPGGAIRAIDAQLRNIATETARGIDAEIDFRHALAGGHLHHRALVSRVEERELVAFSGAEPLFGAGGFDADNFGAIPEWQGTYSASWTHGAWTLGYQAQWVDAIKERGGEVFPGTFNRVGSVLYHDLRVGWRTPAGFHIETGIDNLTDVDPPFLANADEANTDLGTYRSLGTIFWLRLNFRWDQRPG